MSGLVAPMRRVVNVLRAACRGEGRFGPSTTPFVETIDGKPLPSCGWSAEEENQRGRVVDGVSVRRYPFPYRCAFALSNDTDYFTHNAFEAFHAFVSGKGETPFGTGLNLEISDSFWIWSTGKELSLYHAGPWQDDAPPSPEHERVLELARAGWLDTLHGFGDWSEDWHLDRERMARALDYLDSRGVNLKVYVGHGGVNFNMTHNYGGPWGYYQHADDKGHKSYCLDLLKNHGFLYFWSDPFYELDKFGEDLVFDDQAQLDTAVVTHDFHRYFFSNDPDDFQRSREVFPDIGEEGRMAWRRMLFNRILIPVTSRDGNNVYEMKRFRGHDGPMAGNFIVQANPLSLNLLEARQGAVVVYQHFGVWRALFMGKQHASQRASRPESVLDEHNAWAFRTLAERHHDGRVFVTSTRRLCDFLRTRDGLDFSVDRSGDCCVITVTGVDCPVTGRFVPEASELQGIAFEVPRSHGEPLIVLGGRELSAKVAADPADERGIVVHLPWKALEWPG